MSALTKPLTHSPNTIGGESDAINVEQIAAMTKVVVDPAEGINTSGSYHIVFKFRGENTTPQEVTWKYEDEATLDTDYTELLSNNSVSLT